MEINKKHSWPGWSLALLLSTSLMLGGCIEGDDGAQGPTGPSGSPSIVKSETPDRAISNITSATVASSGALTVEFSVTDTDGNGYVGLATNEIRLLAASLSNSASDGDSTAWSRVAYERDRSGYEFGDLTDNGDGTYRYTFGTNLGETEGYSAGTTYRVGLQLDGDLRPSNATFDFVPSGGASLERKIVAESACNSCHGELRMHGGRVATDYCVLCHNPDLTPADFDPQVPGKLDPDPEADALPNVLVLNADFKVMVHKIHRGANLPSVKGGASYGWGESHDYSDVHFPQDIRNCTSCHNESNDDTPQASNWRLVPTMEACGSCHDDVDFTDGVSHAVQTDNSGCAGCHNDSVPELSVSANHEGVVANNADLAALLVVDITSLAVAGADVTVNLTMTLDGAPVTSLAAGANSGGAEKIGKYKYGTDNGALAVNWDDGTGFQLNHQEVDFADCAFGSDGSDGKYICTAVGFYTGSDPAADVITVTPVDLFVCVDEADGVLANCQVDGSLNPTVPQIPVPAVVATYLANGTAASDQAYDKLGASIEQCRSCHKDNHFHHGATELVQCKTCHNATRTSSSRTVADLKRHVHRKHSGLDADPLDVADNPVDLYPNQVDNCSACHAEGQFDLPLQQNGRASKARTGRNDTPVEVYVSPTAVVCGSCHISTLLGYIDSDAIGYLSANADTSSDAGLQPPTIPATDLAVIDHMVQNGAIFGASDFATANKVESCSVCHAIGSMAGVDEAHTLISVDSGSSQ